MDMPLVNVGSISNFVRGEKPEPSQVEAEDINSYVSAVEEDPGLTSLDSILKQQATRMMNLMTTKDGTHHSLLIWMDVFKAIHEVGQFTKNVITECNEDVWKNKDVGPVVEEYLQSTGETLALVNTVEKGLAKTQNSNLILQFAVKLFEKHESKDKYAKTLEALKKFEPIGDPFGEEFATQLASVWKHQLLLLKKIRKLRKKNLFTGSRWKLGTALFVTTLALIALIAFAACTLSTPHGAIMVSVIGVKLHIKSSVWITRMFNMALKTQEELSSVESAVLTNNWATKTIELQVQNLTMMISSMLETVNFAVKGGEEEEAINIAMQKIKGDIESFTEKIEGVKQSAATCNNLLVSARLGVLEHTEQNNIKGK